MWRRRYKTMHRDRRTEGRQRRRGGECTWPRLSLSRARKPKRDSGAAERNREGRKAKPDGERGGKERGQTKGGSKRGVREGSSSPGGDGIRVVWIAVGRGGMVSDALFSDSKRPGSRVVWVGIRLHRLRL